MNRLKNKLQNARGASMIIALVFMLICLFVGGSVLVAATMNTKRLEHEDKYQVFLDRRSAASLISDELKTDDSDPLRLVIYEIQERRQTDDLKKDGNLPTNPITAPATYRYRFEVYGGSDPLKGMKKLVIGSAIRNFEKEGHNLESPTKIDLVYNETRTDHTGKKVVEVVTAHDLSGLLVGKPSGEERPNGQVNVAISTDAVELRPENKAYTVDFRMDDKSNFIVGFDYTYEDESSVVHTDDFSMLEVRLYGSKAIANPPAVFVENIVDKSEGLYGKCTRIETTTTTSSIIWDDPVVRKEGTN